MMMMTEDVPAVPHWTRSCFYDQHSVDTCIVDVNKMFLENAYDVNAYDVDFINEYPDNDFICFAASCVV